MTREEADLIYNWLRASYPRRYNNQDDFTKAVTKDNLFLAYETYDPSDVMTGYRHFLEQSPYEPAISDVKAYLAEREAKQARAAAEPEPSIDDLPEHHYMRGRYVHDEALEAWQRDERNRTRNGKKFKDYIKEYPQVVWRPWASGPPEHWKGTEYTGWERDENGFVRPKGCKPKFSGR